MFTISDTLLKAISWTLVHTIWQGFVLAFLAGIVILTTKKATSVLRYNLFTGLFLSFIVIAGLTFNYEYGNENEESVKSLNFSIENIKSVWTIENGTVSNSISVFVIDFLNTNANTIVLIWFIIFCIKSFNITSNLSHIYKIRNYRNQPVSDYWKERLESLSQAIQLNKSIVLLESQLVKVPSVTGFFKPIILLPIGMLSQLPQDQVEAIMLHELAHIRRKDYFINLIQSFAEIVFFFNPGVLWVSSIIKEERENCCDDIAVSVTQCKTRFVHALISFQEYNMKNNELIMGFGGKKNHLLNRAKRIIHNDTKSLNAIEKTFLSIAVFSVVMVMLALGNPSANAPQVETVKQTKIVTSEEVTTTFDTTTKKKQITTVKKSDTIVTNIQNEYCDVVPKAIVMTKEEAEKQANAANQKQDADKKRLEAEVEKHIQKSQSNTVTTYEKTSVTDNKKTERERIVITAAKTWDDPDKISQNIIVDLTSEKIITGTVNLSFNLSDTKLEVNGKIQSDSVHKKFKQKYLVKVQSKHPVSDKISIVYNYDISNLVACN